MKWVCCQLGAREHYAIPRALLRVDRLGYLLTDAWVPPSSLIAKLCGRRSKLGERFHEELRDRPVKAFNSSLILFELLARARRLGGWEKIIARNRWFQKNVCSFLRSQLRKGAWLPRSFTLSTLNSQEILLSYSYTALEPFRHAKSRGWKTVLMQIDPGPEEERIVAEEVARVPELAGDWQPAPREYWDSWRQECELADCIVVNSEWSREGLMCSGVPVEKLSVIPLAYEPPDVSRLHLVTARREGQKSDVGAARLYPDSFTNERPMRVLFLGQANLRKGIARLLDAARILRGEPVEFWMVGLVEIANAGTIGDAGNVKWVGAVRREKAAEYYRNADVFILPTLSDGFAITQLEAQSYGLPIISSRFCGRVVENGRNGIVLEEPSAACVAAAIRDCIANPNLLQQFAAASRLPDEFTIDALAQRLKELGSAL
jgi:glycosyltransferase involved in cell wall biosynthesis